MKLDIRRLNDRIKITSEGIPFTKPRFLNNIESLRLNSWRIGNGYHHN